MTPLYAGIGGVVRELTEMDAGINGVVTPLTEMWAGVNGVQRQIFQSRPSVVNIKIVGEGAPLSYAWVTIDGTDYYTENTIEVPYGTTIVASAWQRPNQDSGLCGIYVNGTLVTYQDPSSTYGSVVSYNFIANTDTTVYLDYVDGSPSVRIGLVSIASQLYEHQFTVNGRPYQFDPGMTWNTFVPSVYNVDKFWINFGSMVVDPITNNTIYNPSGNISAPSEVIIENGAYTS